jgi:hypothetical protein
LRLLDSSTALTSRRAAHRSSSADTLSSISLDDILTKIAIYVQALYHAKHDIFLLGVILVFVCLGNISMTMVTRLLEVAATVARDLLK